MTVNQAYYWFDNEKIGLATWDGAELQPLTTSHSVTIHHNRVFDKLRPVTEEGWEHAELPIDDEFSQVLVDGLLYTLYKQHSAEDEMKLTMSKHFYMVFEKELKDMKKARRRGLQKTSYIRPVEF